MRIPWRISLAQEEYEEIDLGLILIQEQTIKIL